MIGLEHEADVLAPQLGQVLGVLARDRIAADANGSFGRRQHAAENGQQRGLAAARRPHQQRQLAALERQVDALERADLRGPVAEVLGDARCFHHRLAHRVNTMAGSMRVTFMIAAIAETTHITTVSTNSADGQARRDDDRQRARRRHAHHQEPDEIGQTKPDHGAQQRLADDDLVDVSAGRADGAQRGKLVQVILGAGIERLRDDHGADDDAEQRAGEQRRARAGAEQPERAAALAKFGRRQHLDVGETGQQIAADLLRRRRPGRRAPGNRWPCSTARRCGRAPDRRP